MTQQQPQQPQQPTDEQIVRLAEGRTFVSLLYRNNEGEVSRQTIVPGPSVTALYQKDIAQLTGEIIPALEAEGDAELLAAAQVVLASRRKSLEKGVGQREDYTARDTYTHLTGSVKRHRETGALYIVGIVVKKEVKVPVEYKPVNSKAATIARRKIEKMLGSSTYRQFLVKSIARIAAKGEVLEIDQFMD